MNDASLSKAIDSQTHSFGQEIIRSQPFWVTIAAIVLCFILTLTGTTNGEQVFFTPENFSNIALNFSFIGIIAIGMTAVIITAGIDLSVGSVMGLAGIATGLTLSSGYGVEAGIAAGILTALACGLVNGILISYIGLSPFVVTLGMLSICRSLALVVSNNKMFYEFGPDEELFLSIGGGTHLGVANSLVVMLVLTIFLGFMLNFTAWGRHLYAIGSNESAATMTGVPVKAVKLSAYLFCSLTAGISAVMIVGWMGSVTNALGMTYELRVIASAVIGGADLMGGVGTAYGALIGSILVELIRNGLLMAGVDPYWQGTFVGLFIIFAVALEKIRSRRGG
ncbi:MAG: ABC transporter permease [Deltaproteobacteria bacterium]|jgi:ribose transport system permease protein